jgi:hypothetical protein
MPIGVSALSIFKIQSDWGKLYNAQPSSHRRHNMNKDFDAPQHPQPHSAGPRAERRRSPRWNAHIPVFIYGHTQADAPFHEEAYSAVANDCGALLMMTTTVPVGEKLLLTNKVTQVEQECRVVGIGRRDGPSVEIAIEFTGPAPQFWRVIAGPQRVSPAASSEPYKKAL